MQGHGGLGQAVARQHIKCPDAGHKVQAVWMGGDGKDELVDGCLVCKLEGCQSWADIADALPGNNGCGWRWHRQDDA
jgi:hypothetical protein